MEFREVVKKRTSIRKFKDKPVPLRDLKLMAKYAGMAPSVNNSQPWKFLAVTNKSKLIKMAEAVNGKLDELMPDTSLENIQNVKKAVEHFSTYFVDAPAIIVVLNEPYEAVIDKALEKLELSHEEIDKLRNHPNIQTIGAAVENLLLSAVNLGYGGCWLTGPLVAREELESILKVKAPYRIAACVAIGKPFEKQKPKDKRPLEEIFQLVD